MSAAQVTDRHDGRLRRAAGYGLALAVAVPAAMVSVLAPGTGGWVRSGLWLVAGVALVWRAMARRAPTTAFRVLGVGAFLVGAAWLVLTARSGGPALGEVHLQLLVPGTTAIGLSMLIATPSWRHRASLLDGVVLALAVAGVLVTIVDGDGGTVTLWLAGFALAFTTTLGPAVLVASSGGERSPRASWAVLAVFALVALATAGGATTAAALRPAPLSDLAAVAWVVAPAVGLVVALRSPVGRAGLAAADVGRPAPMRLLGLTLVAFTPALAAAVIAPSALERGLVVSLFAVVVVAARVAVSARFDVEDARAAADVRFDALVEHAAEVLALLDGEGRIFYVSRAVQETFQVPPEEVLGLSPAELAHPEDVEQVEQALGRAPERPGVPVHARIRLMDGLGAARHVEATIVDLRHVVGVEAISLTVRDITERVKLEDELVRQARTDSLTGLVTRTVLMERVDHVMTARRPSAALLFIDLDDFKLVNDGFGHPAGDEVLVVLADRLREEVRDRDTAGRVGGDEFAVLLEDLGEDPVEQALAVARRVVTAGRQPVEIDGEPVEIGLSVGVAMAAPGMTTADLFTAADAAMYEAKRDKAGVLLFEPGMRGSSRSRLRLMRDVRTAINEGTLTLAYQPIVRASTRALHGVEALLRWEHPTLGNITPDIALDHADAVGMTGALTAHILSTISDDLVTWHRATGSPLPVAINLSAQQLVHVDPEEALLQLLGGASPSGRLTIEVTETSMLGDLAAAAQVLSVFRDAGCRIAIDDFGTGYASIGYLRRLPLDELKIDREFIDGLLPSTAHRSFASVIQGLADALGLGTIAEGVETEEQLAAVRSLGCSLVQGFLVSPALPMEELLVWARDDAGLSVHA